MKVVFIGAGNLATHLSIALQKSGFQIAQIYNRSESSAKELSGLLQVPCTTQPCHIVDDASLYIISVSDDAIEAVAKSIHPVRGLVVHTAACVSMDIFSGKFDNYGVFYPLQTFSKGYAVDFSDLPIFLEANSKENLHILQNVAKSISRNVLLATLQEREQLHLAAIFCCNFVNHLYHLSGKIAQRAGFDFNAFIPLITETAKKAILSGNPEKVQTGPAVRKDRKVMQRHLELLASDPKLHEIYLMFSESITKSVHELHEFSRTDFSC